MNYNHFIYMCNHHHTRDIVLPLKKSPLALTPPSLPIQVGPPPRQSQICCFLSYTFLPFLEFHRNRIIQNYSHFLNVFFLDYPCVCALIFSSILLLGSILRYGSITIWSSLRKLMNICIVSTFWLLQMMLLETFVYMIFL